MQAAPRERLPKSLFYCEVVGGFGGGLALGGGCGNR